VYGQVLINSGYVVIGSGHCLFGSENLKSAFIEPGKCLGAGHLVYQVPVNIQYTGTVFDLCDHMRVPYLIE
jgi:hypothetical protein